MTIPGATGELKNSPSTVKIQRRIDIGEDGNEIDGTDEFWLIDADAVVLDGPFSSLKEAVNAYRTDVHGIGYGSLNF